MKIEKFSGEVMQAYGKQLPAPVKVEGSYEAYESHEELVAANDLPSHDEILGFVNARRKASERAKATTAALDAAGYKKPDPNDPIVVRANLIKVYMKTYGLDESTATKLVDSVAKAAEAAKAAVVA